jgi:glycosyltransferase involved in cell wall biosynthesis
MISIIIPEHKEEQFITPMLDMINNSVPSPKEVIFVSSAPSLPIPNKNKYRFSIRVIPNILSAGKARNIGAQQAIGNVLLFMDCHVCLLSGFSNLLDTLKKNPKAVVIGGIQPIAFPGCSTNMGGGIGWGVYFSGWWQWHWGAKDPNQDVFPVPFSCACFEMMKRQTFYDSIWGFIDVVGLGIEEEINMRLLRFGHPTLCDSRCVIGHVFKTAEGNFGVRTEIEYAKAIATLLNIFDKSVYNQIVEDGRKILGKGCDETIERAYQTHGERRMIMSKLTEIDEHWFVRSG